MQLTPESVILICVILTALLPLAIGAIKAPIRFRQCSWHTVESGFEPCKDNSLPPDVNDRVDILKELGFVVLGTWQYSGFSRATAKLTLMEHPHNLDVAKVMISTAGRIRVVVSQFQTRFEDGTEIATANNPLSSGLPSFPDQIVVWLPEMHDLKQLYAVHTEVIAAQRIRKKKLPIGPNPTGSLIEARDRLLAHLVDKGYYYRDDTVYRPTWKGALLLTYRHLWPVRRFYQSWRRRPTRELLRELGIHLEHD